MSGVRMCDDCGTIFSENADGVSSGSITVQDEKSGAYRQRTLDYCDVCSNIKNGTGSKAFFRRPANSAKEITGNAE